LARFCAIAAVKDETDPDVMFNPAKGVKVKITKPSLGRARKPVSVTQMVEQQAEGER
jgi:hypothetical protein